MLEHQDNNDDDDDETMLLTTAAIVLAFFVGLGAWLMAPEDFAESPEPVLSALPEPLVGPTSKQGEEASNEPSRERRDPGSSQPPTVQVAAHTATAEAVIAADAQEVISVNAAVPQPSRPEPANAAPVLFEPVEPQPISQPEPGPVPEPALEPKPIPEPGIAPQAPTQGLVATIDEATSKVAFVTASTQLTDESKAVLDKVAALMAANPNRRVGIIGHTDSQGDADANVILSFARAQACADYLAGKNIEATRLEVAGMGEQMPLTSNLLAAGREQNRRVEFRLLEN